MSDAKETATPFLKWVGGKTQILHTLFEQFPKQINSYYELFLGGGSVLISLLEKNEEQKDYCTKRFETFDINPNLIYCYLQIKNNHKVLLKELSKLQKTFLACSINKSKPTKTRKKIPIEENMKKAKKSREHLYYFLRHKYRLLVKEAHPKVKGHKVENAVLFIFLNKTCFRGLYREGKNGFNVPYGNYKNPSLFNKENINRLNYLFNKYNVNFSVSNFHDFLNVRKLSGKDFVYLDPPYYPENTKSFTAYNCDGFSAEDNVKLKILLERLDLRKVKFVMSNSNVKWNLDNYSRFNIKKILCRRAINAKNPNSKTYELLISNDAKPSSKSSKSKSFKSVSVSSSIELSSSLNSSKDSSTN